MNATRDHEQSVAGHQDRDRGGGGSGEGGTSSMEPILSRLVTERQQAYENQVIHAEASVWNMDSFCHLAGWGSVTLYSLGCTVLLSTVKSPTPVLVPWTVPAVFVAGLPLVWYGGARWCSLELADWWRRYRESIERNLVRWHVTGDDDRLAKFFRHDVSTLNRRWKLQTTPSLTDEEPRLVRDWLRHQGHSEGRFAQEVGRWAQERGFALFRGSYGHCYDGGRAHGHCPFGPKSC